MHRQPVTSPYVLVYAIKDRSERQNNTVQYWARFIHIGNLRGFERYHQTGLAIERLGPGKRLGQALCYRNDVTALNPVAGFELSHNRYKNQFLCAEFAGDPSPLAGTSRQGQVEQASYLIAGVASDPAKVGDCELGRDHLRMVYAGLRIGNTPCVGDVTLAVIAEGNNLCHSDFDSCWTPTS